MCAISQSLALHKSISEQLLRSILLASDKFTRRNPSTRVWALEEVVLLSNVIHDVTDGIRVLFSFHVVILHCPTSRAMKVSPCRNSRQFEGPPLRSLSYCLLTGAFMLRRREGRIGGQSCAHLIVVRLLLLEMA